MALTKYERETIILYNDEESTASVYTLNVRLRNRLAAFAEKSDDCCLVRKGDDYDEYRIPKSWLKINLPRQYSDKQRQKMAERARANLLKKKGDVADE